MVQQHKDIVIYSKEFYASYLHKKGTFSAPIPGSSLRAKYHSGKFIWANPKISSSFSPIFPSFVYLVLTKPMNKWSRTPGQVSGGHWVEHKTEFWLKKKKSNFFFKKCSDFKSDYTYLDNFSSSFLSAMDLLPHF